MAGGIEWLRLWHDMPTDPKWRSIARASGQPLATVLAVAVVVMVDASRNVTRGHVTVTPEDVASAIDVTDEAAQAVLAAMQGRILDGDQLSGWEKRQPKREDAGDPESGAKSAAQRKREQREREKQLAEAAETEAQSRRVTTSHAKSREVTLEKSREEQVSEEDKSSSSSAEPTNGRPQVPCQYQAIVDAYHAALPMLPRVKVMDEKRKAAMRKRWAWVLSSTKPDGSRRATTGDEAVAWFVAFFERASANDWLTGRIPPGKGHDGWRCTLDFLMKDDGLKAVVERTEAVAA